MTEERTVIILAAGDSRRMRSALSKMLHPLLRRTLIGHVLAATESLHAGRRIVVVGHGADQLTRPSGPGRPRRAHRCCRRPAAAPVTPRASRSRSTGWSSGTAIVVNGDVPLLRPGTMRSLVLAHEAANAAATLLTAEVGDPCGLGPGSFGTRPRAAVAAIVEARDARPEQRAIPEINAGVYAFEAALRWRSARSHSERPGRGVPDRRLRPVRRLGAQQGRRATGETTEVLGCNDRVELAGCGGFCGTGSTATRCARVSPSSIRHYLDRCGRHHRARTRDRAQHPA